VCRRAAGVADVDAQVCPRDGCQRELSPREGRLRESAVARRLEDLVEVAVSVQRHRPAEDAIIEEGGVDLRLAPMPVELDVRAAAAEEVTAGGASWVDRVLREDHRRRK